MEENSSTTHQLPQKIALKVPSLFIQGTSRKSKGENNANDEDAASKPTDGAGSNNESQNEAAINGTKKIVNRPMPAFAKKKLEQKKANLENTELSNKIPESHDSKEQLLNEQTSDETPKTPSPSTETATANKTSAVKTKSRPMPASARRKLEVNEVKSTTTTLEEKHEVKMTEAFGYQNKVQDDNVTEKPTLESSSSVEPKKVKPSPSKAVPASVRRKLEEKLNQANKTENNNKGSAKINGNTTEFSDSSNDAPTETKEAPVETLKETKTISLSISGIKFPTFTKPKPTLAPIPSANEDSKPPDNFNHDLSSTTEYDENQSKERRTRRGNPAAECISLHNDKYPCELCGAEFYSLSKLKIHNDSVHLGIKPKKSTKPKSSKTGGAYVCRHCGESFSKKGGQTKKRFAKHIRQCKPLNFACDMCDKKFPSEKLLTIHKNSKIHAKPTNEVNPQSSLIRSDSRSSKNSTVSSTSQNTVAEVDPVNDDESDTPVRSFRESTSFKRKIASVLSKLKQDDIHKKIKLETGNDDKDSLTKRIVSKNRENIKGRPMPASIRKKLENRVAKSTESFNEPEPTTTTTEEVSSLDDYTCEVCFRIFSQKSNRKRHEVTVHGILDSKHERPSPKGKLFPTTAKLEPDTTEDFETKSNTNEEAKQKPIELKSKSSNKKTLSTITIRAAGAGRCPICSSHRSKVRKHLINVHKIDRNRIIITSQKDFAVSNPSPPTKLSAPKSYKIYKSATKKDKQKLSTPSSNKSPDVVEKSSLRKDSSKLSSPPEAPAMEELEPMVCDDIEEEPPGVPESVQHHMQMKTVKKKKIITCKICLHLFSHEDDFIVHMKYKHKDTIGTVHKPQTETKVISKKTTSTSSSKITPAAMPTSYVKGRVTRNSSQIDIEIPVPKPAIRMDKEIRISISATDKKLAEKAKGNKSSKTKTRSTSSSNYPPSPLSEPEPMDTYYDSDQNDDPVEFDPIDKIEIKSTFSQKPSVVENKPKLDEMPCSACSEVFYSYEALRKHELYFHNVKTTKMCPICGVYPTRLSRHLMAHENKTVRCSCAPCRLNFDDFSKLLKHNIEKHPGPNGGAMCATNKTLFVNTDEYSGSDTPQKESPAEMSTSTSFRCAICYRSCTSAAQARRHVRRVHAELGDNAENYVEEVNEQTVSDVSATNSSDDTKPKRTRSSSTPAIEPNISKPKSKTNRPGPASVKAKLAKLEDVSTVSSGSNSAKESKPNKPMPASVREKLAKQQEEAETGDTVLVFAKKSKPMPASVKEKVEKQEEEAGTAGEVLVFAKKRKPMPASARAKLANQDEESVISSGSNSTQPNKPVRPMPASVRAKLESQQEESPVNCDSDKSSKPSRPMPASARAKLEAQPEEKSAISDSESNVSKPSRPMPASARAKLESQPKEKSITSDSDSNVGKPSRPMPASARAKIQQNDDDDTTAPSKSNMVKKMKFHIPMPASIRAKFSNDKPEELVPNLDEAPTASPKSDSADAKLRRPGPASVKAKLARQHSKSTPDSGSDSTERPKPYRPGPASMKAKLNKNNYDDVTKEEVTKPVIRPGRPMPASVRAKLAKNGANSADSDSDLETKTSKRSKHDEDPDFEPNDSDEAQVDDDADDVHMDDYANDANSDDDDVQIIEDIEEPVLEDIVPSAPTFSIADEIAEHNQSLISSSTGSTLNAIYQCKLCNKKFNSDDSTRKHIQRVHSEYGPDHTENLIEEIHDTYESGRPRRSTVKYVEDYTEEPDEEERIIPRGTSTRPRAGKKDVWSPPEKDYSSFSENDYGTSFNFACKICNKQLNSSANVKRHVGKAHRHIIGPFDKYVVQVGANYVNNDVVEPTWISHVGKKTFISEPSFNCPYCPESFDGSQNLALHLAAEHSNTEAMNENEDEPEISMDEMAGMGEISISTTTRIKLDHPKPVVLSKREASDHEDEVSETDDNSNPLDEANPIDDDDTEDTCAPVIDEQMDTVPEQLSTDPEPAEEDTGPAGFTYQADLSSLFPSLKNADGGLEAINHFEEGMSLD